MKCEEVGKNRLEYLDGFLPADLCAAIDEHLLSCPACREEIAGLRASWDMLDLYGEVPPSEDFTAKTVSSFRRIRRRERFLSGFRRVTLAAAAVVLIGLSLFYFNRPPSDTAGGGDPVAVEDLIENLSLIEDMELLQAFGDDLDIAMEYENYLALGGEESL
jgi:predicted anti-sigma-YlaC factor YlaD